MPLHNREDFVSFNNDERLRSGVMHCLLSIRQGKSNVRIRQVLASWPENAHIARAGRNPRFGRFTVLLLDETDSSHGAAFGRNQNVG